MKEKETSRREGRGEEEKSMRKDDKNRGIESRRMEKRVEGRGENHVEEKQ